MSNTETFYNELHTYIQKVANQIVDLNGSNTVVMGTIEESRAGYYNVKITNSDITSMVKAIALGNGSYKVNDYVYLIKATNRQGETDPKFFIFGLVSDVQEEYVNLTDWERFQAFASKEISKHYYNGEITELKVIEGEEDSAFLTAVKEKGAISVSGYFNCPSVDGVKVTDYGLEIILTDENSKESHYYLNTDYFTGQPFNTLNSFQKRVIVLDKDINLSSITVNLWAKKISDNITNDFWVDQIKLSAGALVDVSETLSVKVAAENEKNYFYKINPEAIDTDSITLTATAYYGDQTLSASSIQYYWLIKDEDIDETNERYLPFVGKGWRCINNYYNVNALGIEGTIQVWDNKKNSISFDKPNENDTGDFSNYLTQLKCAIKYQNVVAISDKFEILNFEKEDFEINISANVDPRILFLESDRIILTAEVASKNKYTNIIEDDIAYQWYKKDNINDKSIAVSLDGFTSNQLIIKDNGEASDVNNNIYEMDTDSAYFYCVATITKGDSSWEEISEPLEIISKVAVAAELKQPTYYKYYISNSDSVLFYKEDGNIYKITDDLKRQNKKTYYIFCDNGDVGEEYTGEELQSGIPYYEATGTTGWTGGWVITDPTDEADKKWVEVDNKIDNEAFDSLKALTLDDNEYLYYTYRTIWKEEKDEKTSILKKDNWSLPRLLKGKIGDIPLSDATIDKINTFNDLTGGGQEQGVYLEDVYYQTEDAKPIEEKTYYYISGTDANNKPIYTKFEGTEFDADKKYFDKYEKKLYINAEYIKTGTLLVGDNKGNARFYADIDSEDVKIAGFTVDEDSISHGKQNEKNYIYLGTDGLNVGGALNISIDEKGNASASFIGSFEIASYTDKTGTIANKNEVNTVQNNLEAVQQELDAEIYATKTLINETAESLQQQIDGSITTWYGEGKPAFSNENNITVKDDPAQYWTDIEKKTHNGDLYYNKLTGKCYRWQYENENKYYWTLIADEEITEALKIASEAKDTADGKRKIFYGSALPTPPYDYRDVWMQGTFSGTSNGQIYICTREEGRTSTESADARDWERASDFVTQYILNTSLNTVATEYKEAIKTLDEEITASIYFKAGTLTNTDGTEIPAVVMKALDKDINYGLMYFNTNQLVIQSTHLKLNHNGTDYIDGYFTIDTDNFKLDEDGNVTVTGIINATSLSIGEENFGDIRLKNEKEIQKANNTADQANNTANTASGVANQANSTANTANSTANEAKDTANEAKEIADENTSRILNINQTINELNDTISATTYFGVNTKKNYIYLKSKTENPSSPGIILLDTDTLMINSDALKFNYDGTQYSPGYLKITTVPLILADDKLTINIADTVFNGQISANNINTQGLSAEYILVKDNNDILFEVDGRVNLNVQNNLGKRVYAKELSGISTDMGVIKAGKITSNEIMEYDNLIDYQHFDYSFDNSTERPNLIRGGWTEEFTLTGSNISYYPNLYLTTENLKTLCPDMDSIRGFISGLIYGSSTQATLYYYNDNGSLVEANSETEAYIEYWSVFVRSVVGWEVIDKTYIKVNLAPMINIRCVNDSMINKTVRVVLRVDFFSCELSYNRIIGQKPKQGYAEIGFDNTEKGKFGIYFPNFICANDGNVVLTNSQLLLSDEIGNYIYIGGDTNGIQMTSYDYGTTSESDFWDGGMRTNYTANGISIVNRWLDHNDETYNILPLLTYSFANAQRGAVMASGEWTFKNIVNFLSTVYNFTGSAVINSDKNVKNSIQLQPEIYSLLFDKIKPSIFKYNNGTSDRYHTGLIAQDLEQAVLDVGLTTQDFAAVCYDINENGEKKNYGIRYEELVSMCIYEIQQNKSKIAILESERAQLEYRVAELENLLYNNN